MHWPPIRMVPEGAVAVEMQFGVTDLKEGGSSAAYQQYGKRTLHYIAVDKLQISGVSCR